MCELARSLKEDIVLSFSGETSFGDMVLLILCIIISLGNQITTCICPNYWSIFNWMMFHNIPLQFCGLSTEKFFLLVAS